MVINRISGSLPDWGSRNVDTNGEPNALDDFSEDHIPRQILQKSGHGLQIFREPENLHKDLQRIVENRNVLCHGFSIREYVGKIRTVDIRKCWPLSKSLLEDRLRDGKILLLPPLKSPSYKWWACERCLINAGENAGEHKNCGKLFDRQQIVNNPTENNTSKIDEKFDKELTISRDTFSEADPYITQELEEQIRERRTFQISAQEENISTGQDRKRRVESTDQPSVSIGQNVLQPSVKVAAGKRGTSKCASKVHKKAKAEPPMQKDQEDQLKDREFDATIHKTLENQTQVQNFTFHLMQKGSELSNRVNIKEEREKKARRVKTKAKQVSIERKREKPDYLRRTESQAKQVSIERKRKKPDYLRCEANNFDSVKHGISDVSNPEPSGPKICPVCKIFTSTTITAVNVHMDGCLARASKADRKQGKQQKQKSRTRKKRSIVEICASSPAVQIFFNYLENSKMDKSEGYHGVHIHSDEGTANLPKKNTRPTEAGAESVVGNDISSLHCKRKKATEAKACTLVKSTKDIKGQTETSQTKRKLQRGWKDVKEPKLPFAPINGIEKDEDDAPHHPKHSGRTLEATNFNVAPQSTEQMNLKLHSSLDENQEHQQFGSPLDHTPPASMLPKEHKKEDINSNNTPQVESERVIEDDPTEEPSSIVTMANAHDPITVCHPNRTEDTVSPQNQSSPSVNEKSYLLAKNGPRHDKADSTDSSRVVVKEQSKPQDPDSICCNPANSGENQQLNKMNSCPKCSLVNSVEGTSPVIQHEISDQHLEPVKFKHEFSVTAVTKDQQSYAKHSLGNFSYNSCAKNIGREKENSNGLDCLQKEGPMSETTKAGKSHIKSGGLNLNQKLCVLQRDARGRFISSARLNGEKESDIPYPQSKEIQSHKSSIKRNTSTIKNETSFALNAGFINARSGKSSSLQTFLPSYQDYHSGKKSVAQEVLFSYAGVESLSAGREALLPTAALSRLEAPSSLNAMNCVKFCMPRQSSNYGYIGLPLDSQGELVKYFPYMRAGVNQLHKITNHVAANEHLVTECIKKLQEFNFMESMETSSHDVTSVNRPDHCQEYSVTTTNKSRHDRTSINQSSPLDQIQRDTAHCGSSHIRIVGSSIVTLNINSDPRLCIQQAAESGYHGGQNQNPSALEKSYREAHNTRKEHSTTQQVIKLMGQNFTIEDENEVVNDVKDFWQGNMKISQCIPRVTVGVSSSIAMADYGDKTHNEDQFHQPDSSVNTSWQDPGKNANASKDLTESSTSESFRIDKATAFNELSPQLGKRLPKSCAVHMQFSKDQTNSSQAWISSSPFYAPTAISPFCHMSTNTCVNERHKITCKDSYIRDQGCLLQKLSYSQLLKSCLGQNRFEKPEYNGWMYTSNPCSCQIQSELVQPLPCPASCSRSLSDPLPTVICPIVHSASFPTETLYQPTPSSISLAHSANMTMQGKHTYSQTNASERQNMILELPDNMNKKRFKTSLEKGKIIDIVDPESEWRDDSRESVQGAEALHRKWNLEEHENYGPGTLQKHDPFSELQGEHKRKQALHREISSSSLAVNQLKSRELSKNSILHFRSGEIYRTNDSRVESAIDEGMASKRKRDTDCILNAPSHIGITPKCQAKECATVRGTNDKL